MGRIVSEDFGEAVIRVSRPQEKDDILQEVPVSLPGEVLEISGFFEACDDYEFYPEQEQIETGYVFQFHGVGEHEWVQYQPYELENRDGKTGKEWLIYENLYVTHGGMS